MVCNTTHHQTSGRSKQDESDGLGMLHVWETRYVHKEFWWEVLRKNNTWKTWGVDGKVILKWIFRRTGGGSL